MTMKDIQISIAAVMVIAGLFGMWVHFRIMKRNGRVAGNFVSYLLADNQKGTGITLFAYFVSIGGLFALGAFDALNMDAAVAALHNGVIYAPLAQGIAQAMTAGYVADSMLNSGSKP
jgi:hypothetical protein